jgi:hypothetical protein
MQTITSAEATIPIAILGVLSPALVRHAQRSQTASKEAAIAEGSEILETGGALLQNLIAFADSVGQGRGANAFAFLKDAIEDGATLVAATSPEGLVGEYVARLGAKLDNNNAEADIVASEVGASSHNGTIARSLVLAAG